MAKMKSRLYLRLPDELDEALRAVASRKLLQPSECARIAISEYVERNTTNGQFVAAVVSDAPANGHSAGEAGDA